MASFKISSYTDSSVTIAVTGIQSGQTIRFYVREDPGNTAAADKSYTASATYMTRTLSGLSPDTDYACNVKVDDSWIGTQYFTTESAAISVEEWSWSSSNGTATSSQTSKALSAVKNKGSLLNFSYLVWNDMVDKVKEVQEAKGKSWMTKYASYSATKMSSSDKRLTATRFNSLRYNIGYYYSTGIPEVSKGNIVYGYYFTTLANCINQWIAE